MSWLRSIALVLFLAGVIVAGPASLSASLDSWQDFINACTQEGGWVDELGHCGGGLDAYDCGGTLATMSWAQVCFDYCDYPQQQGVQDEWVDGGNAGCVCNPCT